MKDEGSAAMEIEKSATQYLHVKSSTLENGKYGPIKANSYGEPLLRWLDTNNNLASLVYLGHKEQQLSFFPFFQALIRHTTEVLQILQVELFRQKFHHFVGEGSCIFSQRFTKL